MNKIIINVGRQIGCGGCEIAQLLADEFNARLLDKELLDLAAQESGFSAKLFRQSDEHRGFLGHLLHFHSAVSAYVPNNIYEDKLSPEALFKFQSDAIRKAAGECSCVIIGRCADYVLRDMDNVVNVFITADMEDRIACVQKEKMVDAATARRLIESKEEERAGYYNYYTGKRWGDSKSYDLCVNSSLLGIEGTAAFITEFVRQVIARTNKNIKLYNQ